MQTEKIKEQLELLRQISIIDDALLDLFSRLEALVAKRNELKNSINGLKENLESLKNKKKEQEFEARRMEKELKEKETELSNFSAKFHSLKNNREFQQFKEQQEKLRAEVSDLEDKALAMLDSVKQSEIDIQRAEETLKATEERLKIEEKELSAEQERVEREVAYQQENRKKAVSLLPNDVAKKYERIHAKVKRKTVVPVDVDVDKERFICTGCYMSITVQEWNEILRAEELIYCRQCNRILFAPDTV